MWKSFLRLRDAAVVILSQKAAAQYSPLVWRVREIVKTMLTVMGIWFVGIITARLSGISSMPRMIAV